jgi:phosphatidylinositol glycan class W
MSTHKERKTQFVSDLVGGSTSDIYLVTSISAIAYFVWCILKKKTTFFDHVNKEDETFIATLVDFLLNWNNLLFCTTVYANNIPLLIVLNILPLIPVLITSTKKPKSTVRKAIINLNNLTSKQLLPFKTFITVYRAQMMVITCICIIAVDFNIFPRRFGKVETWGTSLMDLGVGSFVFSMGLISARSYLRQLFDNNFNYKNTVIRSFKNSIPIFILGFIRLISVKTVDYHEHVTEYGHHWNFFFTLACLPIINSLIIPIIRILSPLITSLLISIFYEYMLVNNGWLEYIIIGPRDTLLDTNKEGILSLFGYFSIFLNGLALGSCILPIIPISKSMFQLGISKKGLKKEYSKFNKGISALNGMFYLSIFFQLSYYIIDTCYIYSVSRRMANLLYVLWVSAYNCTFLFFYGLIEKRILGDVDIMIINDEDSEIETNIIEVEKVSQEYVPTSLSAVNTNSLFLFLIANLLTGLINLTMNTIDAGFGTSMLALFGYELVLAGISLILYKKGIVLR